MLLLHLADIHFRDGEVGTAMDPNAHLRNEILRDAEEQVKALGQAPDVIVISGDVAFAAEASEFAYALSWLETLCARCGASPAAVFVVPGNHDASRKVSSRHVIQALHKTIKGASDIGLEATIRGLLTDPETGRYLYESLDAYNDFAGRFFCSLLPPERTIASRDLTLNDGSTLRLSGFNSAFVSSAADKKGDLFVDPACLQLKRERGIVHLAVCHHPCSWLRDGDSLSDFLNDVAKIQLFGHEHTNRISLGRDWVRVHASAAHPDKTETGWEPGYNLIALRVDNTDGERRLQVDVHVRVWQTRPGQFRPKMDNASAVFQQSIPLEAWTPPAAPPVVTPVTVQPAEQGPAVTVDLERTEQMDTLREISVRFFKLTLSQKSSIAGKLNLLEEEDANQPDFERFMRVFVRARQRGLIADLDREVKAAAAGGH